MAPPRTPDGPNRGRRRFLKFVAAGTATTAIAAAGAAIGLNMKGDGGEHGTSPISTSTPEVTPENTPTQVATVTVEATPNPEIKSTPYNFINQRVYFDGKLTLQAEENLPYITEGPDTFYPGIESKKTVPWTPSQGLEINPAFPEAAQRVLDGIEVGLLIAWSSQKNIPESQRDLVTTDTEPREEQLRKLNLMKARSARGEVFSVTFRASRNNSIADEDIVINIGDDWKYFIDELSKPPVQIYWQSNAGAGLRISPEKKEIHFELLDQYRGGESLDESILKRLFLSNQISSLIAYLPDLVVEDGLVKANYKKPSYDYAGTEIRRRNIEFRNKYFLMSGSEIIPTLVPLK
jgi:hypothetical protein